MVRNTYNEESAVNNHNYDSYFQHVHLVCTLLLIIPVRLVLNTLKHVVVLAAFVPVRLATSEMMRVILRQFSLRILVMRDPILDVLVSKGNIINRYNLCDGLLTMQDLLVFHRMWG